jgi:hypothetical protein
MGLSENLTARIIARSRIAPSQATSAGPTLSTANVERAEPITMLQRLLPIRAPIAAANGRGTRIKKGWA